ncbi:MAG: 2-hydroxyacyl-CoA dehydratase family protein, partial [Smithellaceae bacterium]
MNNPLSKVPETKQEFVRRKTRQEYAAQTALLKRRGDYLPQYDYFLDILSLRAEPEKFRQKINRPVAALNCLQAPLEIFHALGFVPYRFCSSTVSGQDVAASRLPALACPVIKSALSSFLLEDSIESLADLTVIAGTCDWMVRFPELLEAHGGKIHFMELPHMKESERGRKRWIEEMFLLKEFLEKESGRKMSRRNLRLSLEKYAAARLALRNLLEARVR